MASDGEGVVAVVVVVVVKVREGEQEQHFLRHLGDHLEWIIHYCFSQPICKQITIRIEVISG